MKAFEEHWKHTEIYSNEKQIANYFWKAALYHLDKQIRDIPLEYAYEVRDYILKELCNEI